MAFFEDEGRAADGSYGVTSGYNQIAPGRDVPVPRPPSAPPGRPRGPQPVQSTIAPAPAAQPMFSPQQPPPPFRGAIQTIGAQPREQGGITGGSLATPMQAPPLQAPAGTNAQASPYQAQGPAMGLEGFDAGKLSGGHISPKYVFAKHAQGLGVNDRDELLRRLQADESGYFKNASWGGSKGDVLNVGGQLHDDFKGISQFDVIRAMGEGGKGWQWGAIGENAPAPQGAPVMGGFPGAGGYLDPSVMQNAIMASGVPQGGNDYSQRIMQQILAALQGGGSGNAF